MVSKMSKSNIEKSVSKSPRQWTAREKLEAVLEASRLTDEELGKFLREKG